MFKAAVSDVLAPIAEAMAGVGRGADPRRTSQRLARVLVGLWEREPTKGALVGAVRAAVTSETAAGLLRGIVQEHAIAAVAASTEQPDAELRANLIGATMVGIAVARQVLAVEPIASLSEDALVGVLAGAIEHYLSAELSAATGSSDHDGRPSISRRSARGSARGRTA